MKDALRDANISNWRKIGFSTSKQAQGLQRELVIVLFTKNIRGKPFDVSFISNEDVELTRAEEFLIMLGNFTGWLWAYIYHL